MIPGIGIVALAAAAVGPQYIGNPSTAHTKSQDTGTHNVYFIANNPDLWVPSGFHASRWTPSQTIPPTGSLDDQLASHTGDNTKSVGLDPNTRAQTASAVRESETTFGLDSTSPSSPHLSRITFLATEVGTQAPPAWVEFGYTNANATMGYDGLSSSDLLAFTPPPGKSLDVYLITLPTSSNFLARNVTGVSTPYTNLVWSGNIERLNGLSETNLTATADGPQTDQHYIFLLYSDKSFTNLVAVQELKSGPQSLPVGTKGFRIAAPQTITDVDVNPPGTNVFLRAYSLPGDASQISAFYTTNALTQGTNINWQSLGQLQKVPGQPLYQGTNTLPAAAQNASHVFFKVGR